MGGGLGTAGGAGTAATTTPAMTGFQQAPTLGQTAQQQQATQQQGGIQAGTATANTSPTIGTQSATPAAATGTGTTGTVGTGVGTGPLTTGAGTIGTAGLQNAMNTSGVLNNPMHTNQAVSQAMYNPMVNMPGQAEVASQMATPGQSFVNTQYGQGGLVGNQMQAATNEAAQQGLQAGQQMVGQNVQQGLQGQALQSQMDLAGRQQFTNHMNALLGPALAGTASGFQQGLGGLARGPQFVGF